MKVVGRRCHPIVLLFQRFMPNSLVFRVQHRCRSKQNVKFILTDMLIFNLYRIWNHNFPHTILVLRKVCDLYNSCYIKSCACVIIYLVFLFLFPPQYFILTNYCWNKKYKKYHRLNHEQQIHYSFA